MRTGMVVALQVSSVFTSALTINSAHVYNPTLRYRRPPAAGRDRVTKGAGFIAGAPGGAVADLSQITRTNLQISGAGMLSCIILVFLGLLRTRTHTRCSQAPPLLSFTSLDLLLSRTSPIFRATYLFFPLREITLFYSQQSIYPPHLRTHSRIHH